MAIPRGKVERPRGTRWFEAQFGGRCSACGDTFGAGRSIGYVTAGLVTEDCDWKDEPHMAETAASVDYESTSILDILPPKNGKKCDNCFLYHGPGQQECW